MGDPTLRSPTADLLFGSGDLTEEILSWLPLQARYRLRPVSRSARCAIDWTTRSLLVETILSRFGPAPQHFTEVDIDDIIRTELSRLLSESFTPLQYARLLTISCSQAFERNDVARRVIETLCGLHAHTVATPSRAVIWPRWCPVLQLIEQWTDGSVNNAVRLIIEGRAAEVQQQPNRRTDYATAVSERFMEQLDAGYVVFACSPLHSVMTWFIYRHSSTSHMQLMRAGPAVLPRETASGKPTDGGIDVEHVVEKPIEKHGPALLLDLSNGAPIAAGPVPVIAARTVVINDKSDDQETLDGDVNSLVRKYHKDAHLKHLQLLGGVSTWFCGGTSNSWAQSLATLELIGLRNMTTLDFKFHTFPCLESFVIYDAPSLTRLTSDLFSRLRNLKRFDMQQPSNGSTTVAALAMESWDWQWLPELEEVVLPSNLREIGDKCFSSCAKLKRLDLSHCDLQTIGSSFCSDATSLRSVHFPASLRMVGAFLLCKTAIVELRLGHTRINRLTRGMCSGCGQLRVVDLPDSAAYDSEMAPPPFAGCHRLRQVNLPPRVDSLSAGFGSVPSAKDNTLCACPKCKVDLCIRSNDVSCLRVVHHRFFAFTQLVNSVQLPNSVEVILDDFLLGSDGVRVVDLSNTRLKSIGDNFCADCVSLEHIILPSTVSSIGSKFAAGCKKLRQIEFRDGDISEVIAIAAPDISPQLPTRGAIVSCAAPSANIRLRLSSIGSEFMKSCSLITHVQLQSWADLVAIPPGFLMSNDHLGVVVLPSQITSIGVRFMYTLPVVEVDLTGAVQLQQLPDQFLANNVMLKTLKLPSSVLEIGSSFLCNCSALQALDLSMTSVTRIPSRFASGCTSLRSLRLPASVTFIGSNFLRDCRVIPHLDLTNTQVTAFGTDICCGCPNINALTLALPQTLAVLEHSVN